MADTDGPATSGGGGGELIGEGVVKVRVDVDDGLDAAEKRLKTEGKRRLGRAGDDTGDEIGDKIAEGMGRAISRSRKPDDALNSVAKRSNAVFEGMKFGAAFAGLPVAAATSAALTAGILAGIPAAAIIGGTKLVASNERVQQSYTGLGDTALRVGQRAASGLVDPLVDASNDLDDTLHDLAPMFASVFENSAPVVDEATDAVDALARRAMPGLVVASSRSAEGLATLDGVAADLGQGISDLATSSTRDTAATARNLELVGEIGRDALGFVGELAGNLNSGGTPALERFRDGLQQVYGIMLQATAGGSALSAATVGFIDGVSGGLVVLQGLVGVLGMLPAPLVQFLGTIKALDMITLGRVSGQFEGLTDRMRNADGVRGRLSVGLQALGQAGVVGLAGAGLAFLAEMHSRAAQRAADQRGRVQDLTQSLIESNGVIDNNVRAGAAKAVQDMKVADSGRTLGEYSRDLKISLGDLTDAYLGLPGAQQKVDAQLQSNRDNLKGYTEYADGDAYRAAVKLANGSDYLRGWLAQTNTEFGQAALKAKEVRDAMNPLGSEVEQLGPRALAAGAQMATAFGSLYDPMKSAEDRGAALVAIMDRLNGRTPSLEESLQSINDRFRDLSFSGTGAGDALVGVDGSIDTLTSNGSSLQDVLVGTQRDLATMAQAMRDAGVPTDEINQRLATQTDRLRGVLRELGITPDKIQQVIDRYGLMPSQVTTQLTDLGTIDRTRDGVEVVRQRLRDLPPNTPVRVDGLTDDAIRRLREVGYTVDTLPDGSVTVSANTVAAQQNLDNLVRMNSGRVINMTAVVSTGIPRYQMAANHDGGRIGRMPGHAVGGPVGYEGAFDRATVGAGVPWAGARLFGEKGPEVAFPSYGDYVATAVQTQRMAAGMASGADNAHPAGASVLERAPVVQHHVNVTNHITVPGLNGLSVADLRSLAAKIDRAVQKSLGSVMDNA